MPRLGLLPNTLKDELQDDPTRTLQTLHRMGVAGVEKPVVQVPSGSTGLPDVIAIPVTWEDMPGSWDHMQEGAAWDPAALDTTLPGLVERARAAGADHVVLYWGPSESREQVLRLAGILDALGGRLAAEGLRLAYHNHDHEFLQSHGGRRGIELLLEHTDPAHLGLELDVGWVRHGGDDPAAFLQAHAGRVPLVHLRDVGDPDTRGSFTLPGLGVLDLPALFAAAEQAGTAWIIMEPHAEDGVAPLDFIQATITNLRVLGLVPGDR